MSNSFYEKFFGKPADRVYSKAISSLKSVEEAMAHWLENDAEARKRLEIATSRAGRQVTYDVFALPKEYDNVPYDTYIDHKRVKTVGEAKAASKAVQAFKGNSIEDRSGEPDNWDHIF